MTISYETRLALLGLAPEAHTPALQAIVQDWAARADRITAIGRNEIDPFITGAPAVLSPFAPATAIAAPFTLADDCQIAGPRK